MELITPKFVVLHCSATPDFNKNDPLFDKFGAKDIDKWHKERGFDKIGYHIVIRRSGVYEFGRALLPPKVEKGAHCKPINSESIGICYIGTKIPTTNQIKTLKQLYKIIFEQYGISKENWKAHKDYVATACPGFNIEIIRDLISI